MAVQKKEETALATEAAGAAKTVRLYSDTYAGKGSVTQHTLYGKPALVTEDGFLCVDVPEDVAIGNVDRNFPLMSEPEYKSMLLRIEKSRRQ